MTNWTGLTILTLYKKSPPQLHLLSRLGSFGVSRSLLRPFYDTEMAPVESFIEVLYVKQTYVLNGAETD